jgi:hypothetical protein
MSILGSLTKAASKVADTGKELLKSLLGGPGGKFPKGLANAPIDYDSLSKSTEVLGLIYRSMVRAREDELAQIAAEKKLSKDKSEADDTRNDELVKALTLKRKVKKKKPTPKKEPKKKEEKKPTVKEEPKKEVPKEKPKPEPKNKKVEKGAPPKAPEKIPSKEVSAPKAPEKIPSKEVSAPKAPETVPTKAPAVSTASKVAIGAAGATGVFASSEAFAKTMMPEAERASKALGGKIPPVAILGQWAGESSNGKSVSAPFNYAGIKAGKNDKKGDYVLTEERYTDAQIKQAQASGETLHKVLGPDDKISKKGRQVTIDEWFGKGSIAKAQSEGKQWVQVKSYFAKFDSPEEFTDRYVQFLSSSRYAKARESTTPAQFGLEVAKSGYATASADHYSAGIADYASKYPSLSSASPASAPSSGAKIDQASKQNKDLKDTAAVKQKQQVLNNTNIVQSQSSTNSQSSSEEQDDRNPHQKKK